MADIQVCSLKVDRGIKSVQHLSDAVDKQIYFEGVALNLHGFCTGAERIFEAIAKNIDGEIPAGSEWHKDLLEQMAAVIPGIRPPMVSQSTFTGLDKLRR